MKWLSVINFVYILFIIIFRLKWILVHSIATIHSSRVPFYGSSVQMLTLQLDSHVAMSSPGMLSLSSQMETSMLPSLLTYILCLHMFLLCQGV